MVAFCRTPRFLDKSISLAASSLSWPITISSVLMIVPWTTAVMLMPFAITRTLSFSLELPSVAIGVNKNHVSDPTPNTGISANASLDGLGR